MVEHKRLGEPEGLMGTFETGMSGLLGVLCFNLCWVVVVTEKNTQLDGCCT